MRLGIYVWSIGHKTFSRPRVCCFIFIVVIAFTRRISAPHAYITPNAHTTALLGHDATDAGALFEARKLLRTKHLESARAYFETEVGMRTRWTRYHRACPWRRLRSTETSDTLILVPVFFLLQFLKQREVQTVLSLVANR